MLSLGFLTSWTTPRVILNEDILARTLQLPMCTRPAPSAMSHSSLSAAHGVVPHSSSLRLPSMNLPPVPLHPGFRRQCSSHEILDGFHRMICIRGTSSHTCDIQGDTLLSSRLDFILVLGLNFFILLNPILLGLHLPQKFGVRSPIWSSSSCCHFGTSEFLHCCLLKPLEKSLSLLEQG